MAVQQLPASVLLPVCTSPPSVVLNSLGHSGNSHRVAGLQSC